MSYHWGYILWQNKENPPPHHSPPLPQGGGVWHTVDRCIKLSRTFLKTLLTRLASTYKYIPYYRLCMTVISQIGVGDRCVLYRQ